MTDEGAILLGNAIVKQAADDYKNSFLGYEIYKSRRSREAMIKEIEVFFGSKWFEYLTAINPSWLLKEIKVNALEETIEAYEKALNPGSMVEIKLFARKGRGVILNYSIPERFKDEFFEVIERQTEQIKKEIEEINDSYDSMGG